MLKWIRSHLRQGANQKVAQNNSLPPDDAGRDQPSAPTRTIKELTLRVIKTENFTSELVAKIDVNENLVLEGYDLGEMVKRLWDDSDYEYWLTVDKRYKDTVLLWLIKDRFENEVDFRNWLTEKHIPSTFTSYT